MQQPYDLTLDRISCIPGFRHTHYTIQDCLELGVLLPPPPIQGLQACVTTPGHPVSVFLGTKPRARQAPSAERHHEPLVTPAKSQLSMLLHWGSNLQLMNPNRPFTPSACCFSFPAIIRMSPFVLPVFLHKQLHIFL